MARTSCWPCVRPSQPPLLTAEPAVAEEIQPPPCPQAQLRPSRHMWGEDKHCPPTRCPPLPLPAPESEKEEWGSAGFPHSPLRVRLFPFPSQGAPRMTWGSTSNPWGGCLSGPHPRTGPVYELAGQAGEAGISSQRSRKAAEKVCGGGERGLLCRGGEGGRLGPVSALPRGWPPGPGKEQLSAWLAWAPLCRSLHPLQAWLMAAAG